ncbi:DUF3958 family protein [Carnobacterium gallinarum]|uniref:DUF3958 family protein n=1 Tax=Carnobacterium gallinarum TaxID=2749 RepID=UPI00054E41A4|nr:DUF3958 family protein [Carnobacterium gallinarum]
MTQNLEEIDFQLRQVREQLEDSERGYQKYEDNCEAADSIFQRVLHSFHEDQAIWQDGEMRYRTESVSDEFSITQQQFRLKYEDMKEELIREKSSLVKKLDSLLMEKQSLLAQEKSHEY